MVEQSVVLVLGGVAEPMQRTRTLDLVDLSRKTIEDAPGPGWRMS